MTTSLRLVSASQASPPFCGMVGAHPLMLALFDEIRHAALLEAPVLIEGETGTGKELVAQAVHRLSSRAGRLVVVNAAELAEPLAEAELFGVVRGAYTGAASSRAGLIMSADGGTLFLDEAGDVPVPLQAKLLRVLDGGRVRQVGADTDRPVRLRLVLSVQRPAREMIACGRWREDFFYRVAGIALRIPRLVERGSDIPALANHFLAECGAAPLSPEPLAILASHQWSGNVRELKRVIERVVHRARGKGIGPEDVRHALEAEGSAQADAARRSGGRTLREVEREYIERTLQEVRGEWRAAADVLGLSRSAFYRRLEALGIPRPARSVLKSGNQFPPLRE